MIYWNWLISFFLKFGMVVEYHVQMCRFLPDWSDRKVHHICYVTANFQMWEKSGLWDMDQNASWHHAPWTVGRNLMKPPEFFMVMSIFLKWMPGSNDMGRWQGGVIDSSLTFSFFQSFLLTTKAKKKKKKWERVFHPRKYFNLHACIYIDLFTILILLLVWGILLYFTH